MFSSWTIEELLGGGRYFHEGRKSVFFLKVELAACLGEVSFSHVLTEALEALHFPLFSWQIGL